LKQKERTSGPGGVPPRGGREEGALSSVVGRAVGLGAGVSPWSEVD